MNWDLWQEAIVALVGFLALLLTAVGAALIKYLVAYFEAKQRELEQRYAKSVAETAVLAAEEKTRAMGLGQAGETKKSIATNHLADKLLDANTKTNFDLDMLLDEQVRKMKGWGLEEPAEPKAKVSDTNSSEQINADVHFPKTVFLPDGEPVGASAIRTFAAVAPVEQPVLPKGGWEPGGDI